MLSVPQILLFFCLLVCICTACNLPCTECEGPAPSNCVACLAGFFPIQGVCTEVSFEDTLVIDDFTVGTVQQLWLTLNSTLTEIDPPVFISNTVDSPGCSNLIGCSRDFEIRAFSGFSGRTFSSLVSEAIGSSFEGEWSIASPSLSSGLLVFNMMELEMALII